MAISIDGSANTIAGITSLPDLAVGGVPDGSIDADALATNAVTNVKVADDAFGIAELSTTGTAGSSNYLRGDNAWTALPESGNVLQIKYGTHDGVTSTTNNGNSNSITAGVQLINISFTPVSSSSKLLLQSSTVCVHEWNANQGDHYWTSVWNGTTHVGGNENSPDDALWNNTWGVGWNVINHVGDSGNTNARDIQLRAGGNGSATKYINGGVTYNQSGIRARIGFTVMEYEP